MRQAEAWLLPSAEARLRVRLSRAEEPSSPLGPCVNDENACGINELIIETENVGVEMTPAFATSG